MRIHVRWFGSLTLAAILACNPQRTSAPIDAAQSLASVRNENSRNDASEDHSVLPLDRFTNDKNTQCRGHEYNDFDFWVGKWNASSAGQSGVAGTNVITKETDGCTVEEHWTDPAGVRGRSLNAFDASSGTWNQLWMDQTGGALIFEGAGAHHSMQMAGTHQTSRVDPTPLTDRTTWTSLPGNRVRQFGELSTNGGPFQPVYDITYQGVHTPVAIAPSSLVFCSSPSRPRFHAFDFLIGTWTLHRATAKKTMQTTVVTDLEGCLVEERMHGPDGYEAVAYSGFRSATFVWNWMFMDNRGVQLRLSGPATLTGTNMILTGQRTDNRRQPVLVRVEWVAINTATVEQRWEFSGDGGVTWSVPEIVTMSR